MPETRSEITRNAKHALLEAIAKMAPAAPDAASVRDLAEAYAWAVDPRQPHGGTRAS
jgi:hypothetical protein